MFDYEKYKRLQTESNRQKLSCIWVLEKNIEYLSRYIYLVMGEPEFGLCHGTRRGDEQKWFEKYLLCEVLGTEISDTAEGFANTIQWDFHDVKPEWLGAVDFIYSNAFDHTYDPEKCLSAWMSCLKPKGLCILEHSSSHECGASEVDLFGASVEEMPKLIKAWGKGKFEVKEVIPAPVRWSEVRYISFLVIQNVS